MSLSEHKKAVFLQSVIQTNNRNMFVKILMLVIIALTALMMLATIVTRGPKKKYDSVN